MTELELSSAQDPRLLLAQDCNSYPCSLVIESTIHCETNVATYIVDRYDQSLLEDKYKSMFEEYLGNKNMQVSVEEMQKEASSAGSNDSNSQVTSRSFMEEILWIVVIILLLVIVCLVLYYECW